MSDIVLSASVRQNLLSLQSTASLLATTQNDLSTGNKVNTALDNPTEFFTAQGLNNRASDISNLLDSIGNGVQVLQAANTGITSLQSLVQSAQSVANQVLQSPVGFSQKSSVTVNINGATATNLLGTNLQTNATLKSSALEDGTSPTPGVAAATTALAGTAGSVAGAAVKDTGIAATFTSVAATVGSQLFAGAATNASATTELSQLTTNAGAAQAITAGQSITINNKTINFAAGAGGLSGSGNTFTLGVNSTLGTLVSALDTLQGNTGTGSVASTATGGQITLNTGTAADLAVTASAPSVLTALGINTAAQNTATRAPAAAAQPPAAITAATALFGTGATSALGALANTFANGDTFNVNGHTVTISTATAPTAAKVPAGSGVATYTGSDGNIVTDGNGNSTVFVGSGANSTASVGDLLKAFDLASGVSSAVINPTTGVATVTTPAGETASSISVASVGPPAVAGGAITLESSTGSDLKITASNTADLQALGLSPDPTGAVTATRKTATGDLGTLIQGGSTLSVDGHTITFEDAAAPTAANVKAGSGLDGGIVTDGNGNSTVFLQSASISDVLNAVDLATGVQSAVIGTTGTGAGTATLSAVDSVTAPVSTIGGDGKLNISTGTASDLTISGTGNALAALGLSAGTTGRTGQTLTIASVGGGTATNVTFGTGPGQIQTLNDLNAQLASNNLQATITSTGALTISTTDNAASKTIGAIGGTATNSGNAFSGVTSGGAAPVVDPNAQATRSGLVTQYNNILSQIDTTAQDSSFNGVNLLNSDQLSLTFDETAKSTLNIQGVTFNSAGLGLSKLTVGTDFVDNASANNVLSQLTNASTTLRTEASTLGSNLSIVEVRQDFNKNLINVLQTGASNLTLADTNELAADSQALSTRQSISVSALSLANQSQQSVLQLLR
jgi:flagellin